MLLRDCLEDIEVQKVIGSLDVSIETISQDSRDSSFSAALYFAVKGTVVDGHDYINEVINKSAIAIVCEQMPQNIDENITYVQVADSSAVIGQIAHNFYAKPSNKLKVIAVTGTNGKTTVATYLSQALFYLGQKPLLLSTAGDFFCDEKVIIKRKASSSLEVIELHKSLRKYVDLGVTHVCLEATSHGLDQNRLSGINIDIGIFTNLTQDHLDYHKTMDHYVNSKSLLFSGLMGSAVAVINYDDTYAQSMIRECQVKIVSYGTKNKYDYSFQVIQMSHQGAEMIINNTPINSQVFGNFNMYNLTATYGALAELGFQTEDIAQVFNNISNSSGRLESVANTHNILALVDYAHTPDALENVLNTLSEIDHKNIITVIGCGGDRDRIKRPLMAKIAQEKSDRVIYTADNPRTESLESILQDMREGVDVNTENFLFISDRQEAIAHAVKSAQPGDIILVAGKGHEDYQIVGATKLHFDDREILQKYLNEKSA
jgi:UDP-N-acetylmuramoyl-L-alanyl-D-glutamate--2,6-diaminopimelate ligase